MIRQWLQFAAAVGVMMAPIAADAEELRFSYFQPVNNGPLSTPAYYFSFDLPSDPIPLVYNFATFDGFSTYNAGSFSVSTSSWNGNIPDPTEVTFFSTIPVANALSYDGGFEAEGIATEGVQLYSGLENAPQFSVGTTSILYDDGFGFSNCCSTVTITAVPETATWVMMLAGLGATGFALRRRAKASFSNA